MRKFSYILTLCCTLFLSLGCDREVGPVLPGNEEVILPEGGPYIYLDAMVDKSTRASVVEGTELQQGFGAYGFTYDFTNRWSTYRVTATPNVFTNADGSAFGAPQPVTYDSGIYSYSPVKPWEGGKYTFFAYDPYNHDSVEPSDVKVEGTPYVKYAPANFLTTTANHADVMTAMFEDTSLSSSQYVDFDFEHRLSAVEVAAMNFYMYDHEVDGNVTSEEITIEITDLQVSFTNLDYKAATFYLDSRIPPECVPNDGTPQYYIVDGTKKKEIFYNNNSNFTRVAEDQVMLLIPQKDEDLKVTTKVTYKKRRPDGSDSPYLNAVPDVAGITYVEDNVNGWSYTAQKTTEFGQALKAGSRYYIQVTFTSSAVSINIVTSAEWEDLSEDVYHEFE